MAALTTDDVKHVAELAKLDLSEDEVVKFLSQLTDIVSHISSLSSVDTASVEPTYQTTKLENVYRQDGEMNHQPLTQDGALSGSDNIYNGYFKVKAILENRGDK